MIRILFVETGILGGGSFESLYLLVKNLDRNLYSPLIVFLNDNKFVPLLENIGITVRLINDPIYSKNPINIFYKVFVKANSKFLKYLDKSQFLFTLIIHYHIISEIKRIIKKNEIDLLYLNNQINRDYYGIIIKKMTGVKCISHLRSMLSGDFNSSKAKYANKYIDLFIANSKSCMEHWTRLGLSEEKIKIIYNAIDVRTISKLNVQKEFHISSDTDFIIGCVANFYKEKGHDFLLAAFAEYIKCKSNAILLLIGDGDRKEFIDGLIDRLQIRNNVVLTGYRSNAREIIAGLDLLVVPSNNEAFGRTVLESFSVGTPVIATEIGGLREIIQDNENGLLIEYGNINQFKNAFEKIYTNDGDLKSKLIDNGFKTISEKFSINKNLEKMESLFSKIIVK